MKSYKYHYYNSLKGHIPWLLNFMFISMDFISQFIENKYKIQKKKLISYFLLN